jgi:type II secretory pathway component PulJ
MKITIDTKEDSHQEIRKVISLLQNMISQADDIPSSSLAGEQNKDLFAADDQDTKDSKDASSLFDMFSDNTPSSEKTDSTEPTDQPEANDGDPGQEDDDTPPVITY